MIAPIKAVVNNQWTVTSLRDLLPESAIKKIDSIVGAVKAGKIPTTGMHKKFLEVLINHRKELEEKGVFPDYLAYALEYALLEGKL